MRKKKRIWSVVLCAIAVAIMFAIPASAETGSEVIYDSKDGVATVSGSQAKKTTGGSMVYSAEPYTSDGWSSDGDEWVYFRGRSSSGLTQVTESQRLNYTGRTRYGSLPYLSGYGVMGDYYRIAIQYDSSNPYQYVNLYVTWTP